MRGRRIQIAVGVGVILAALVYLFLSSFSKAKMFYYTMDELRKINPPSERLLKVSGRLDRESIAYDPKGPLLQFRIQSKDGSFQLPVLYRGAMPDLLPKAEEVVLVGRISDGRFLADQLLLKCPSKYLSGSNQGR
jgi:cytochrome c-type biogenesis protein CcmE